MRRVLLDEPGQCVAARRVAGRWRRRGSYRARRRRRLRPIAGPEKRDGQDGDRSPAHDCCASHNPSSAEVFSYSRIILESGVRFVKDHLNAPAGSRNCHHRRHRTRVGRLEAQSTPNLLNHGSLPGRPSRAFHRPTARRRTFAVRGCRSLGATPSQTDVTMSRTRPRERDRPSVSSCGKHRADARAGRSRIRAGEPAWRGEHEDSLTPDDVAELQHYRFVPNSPLETGNEEGSGTLDG